MKCRECEKGEVKVIDVDDCTMTVECPVCHETYLVEPDAFNDGGMIWAEKMSNKFLRN